MCRSTLLLGLVLLALGPAGAPAATPFTVGPGKAPRLAVDDAGSAHVVFSAEAASLSQPDAVGYCRVPRGATACDVQATLQYPPGDAAARGRGPQVFTPSAGKVVVIGNCWSCAGGTIKERLVRWTSTDGGATFSAPVELTSPGDAGPAFTRRDGEGALLEAQGLFVGIGNDLLQAVPPGADSVVDHSPFSPTYDAEVAHLPGTTRLVTAANDLSAISYTVFGGPGLTADAINTQASWSAPAALTGAEPDIDESGLATGPAGIYLSYRQFVPNDARVGLRRFDPVTAAFGAPTYLEGDNAVDEASLDYPDAAQDAAGRVHAVWRTLHDGGRLRYTVSDTTGATFAGPFTVARAESFFHPEVAAAPDGGGFATWLGEDQATVRVVELDPVLEPAVKATFPATKPKVKATGSKVKVSAKGTLAVAAGATCGGKIKLIVKRKGTTVGKATATLAAACTYTVRGSVTRRRLAGAKRLRVTLTVIPTAGTGIARSSFTYEVKVG